MSQITAEVERMQRIIVTVDVEAFCEHYKKERADFDGDDEADVRDLLQQVFKDCLRLRELAGRQTLTRKDNADLERIADRLHALAVMHERSVDE